MARRLAGFVVLMSPTTFQAEKFGPDDDVPAWAAERITAPGAWADGETSADPVPAPVVQAAPVPAVAATPPRSGRGASASAWRSHVEALGLEAPEGASREALIALVDAQD